MFPIPQPSHMPCPDCGVSVSRDDRDEHTCEDDRWLDYQMFQLREEIAGLESGVTAYFESPQGRFEVWYAAFTRKSRP